MSNVNVNKYSAFFSDVSDFFIERNFCLNKDKQIGHSFILRKIPNLNICSLMQFQVEFFTPMTWNAGNLMAPTFLGKLCA